MWHQNNKKYIYRQPFLFIEFDPEAQIIPVCAFCKHCGELQHMISVRKCLYSSEKETNYLTIISLDWTTEA